METTVSIKKLAPSCVSRARGFTAFRNLSSYLSSGDVEVNFAGQELVSISFIDELVLRLMERNQLPNVVFVVATPDIVERLAQVAAIRDADIYIRSKPGEEKKKVEPKQTPELVIQTKNHASDMT